MGPNGNFKHVVGKHAIDELPEAFRLVFITPRDPRGWNVEEKTPTFSGLKPGGRT